MPSMGGGEFLSLSMDSSGEGSAWMSSDDGESRVAQVRSWYPSTFGAVIAGTVRTSGGEPLAGVDIVFEGLGVATTTTTRRCVRDSDESMFRLERHGRSLVGGILLCSGIPELYGRDGGPNRPGFHRDNRRRAHRSDHFPAGFTMRATSWKESDWRSAESATCTRMRRDGTRWF